MNRFAKPAMNRRAKLALLLSMAVLPCFSFAVAPTTIAELWSTINLLDVISAIFGIGALVIGVDLAQLGYQKVRRLVKGAH